MFQNKFNFYSYQSNITSILHRTHIDKVSVQVIEMCTGRKISRSFRF
jgi:hypothetical protein